MASSVSGVRETKIKFSMLRDAIRVASPGLVDKVMNQTGRQQRTLLSLGQHRKGTPTGSIAPNPPWRISGDLRRSVMVDRAVAVSSYRWRGRVGPSRLVPYGRIQELGGWAGRHHRTHLPARPSLKPAWRLVRPTVTRTCARGWRDATRSVLR